MVGVQGHTDFAAPRVRAFPSLYVRVECAPFDVEVKNTGNGHARNLQLTSLSLRVLSGAGPISFNSLTAARPILIGES